MHSISIAKIFEALAWTVIEILSAPLVFATFSQLGVSTVCLNQKILIFLESPDTASETRIDQIKVNWSMPPGFCTICRTTLWSLILQFSKLAIAVEAKSSGQHAPKSANPSEKLRCLETRFVIWRLTPPGQNHRQSFVMTSFSNWPRTRVTCSKRTCRFWRTRADQLTPQQ